MESFTEWRKMFIWNIALLLFYLISTICCTYIKAVNDEVPKANNDELYPTVLVAILVRNKAHTLPYALYYLENLDYPKERLSLWIRTDHNIDNSTGIIRAWMQNVEELYHLVDFEDDDSVTKYSDEKGPCDWSHGRFDHVISLKQQALEAARDIWADYFMMTDADNFLINDQVLKNLIKQNKVVVAPLLNATASEHYANFWAGMDENGYYRRTPQYLPLKKRHTQGCFPVAMVHSTFLINLRKTKSQLLMFNPPSNYIGPHDDIIIFALLAHEHGVALHLLNDDFYGYMQVPMEAHQNLNNEREQFTYLLLDNIASDTALEKLHYIEIKRSQPSLLGFRQIYLINLQRRPDRRKKMVDSFQELGIKYKIIDAVDGKELNDTYLHEAGIRMLPGYEDPYHGNALTKGEIGCFLSHYNIWKDVRINGYKKVLVLEDDIRFHLNFVKELEYVMEETHEVGQKDWDLIYIGRKKLDHENEKWVQGANHLVWPTYSYWTIGYALSLSGAEKMLQQKPLSKMVPVDEFIPILFDKHPTKKWMEQFSPRNLKVMSAEPLLVEPTHYTGDPGYITDTEDSEKIQYDAKTQNVSPNAQLSDQGPKSIRSSGEL